MKHGFLFLSALLLSVSCFGAPHNGVSEAKALAIVRALPEFSELRQRLGDDVAVDGPDQFTPDPLYQVGLGAKAWRVDVYTMVHDDKETAHGNRWAFFRINAQTGDVWVEDFDFETGRFVLKSLESWRLKRNRTNPVGSDHSGASPLRI